MEQIVAAVIGALVGGSLVFAVTWWSLRRRQNQESEQLRRSLATQLLATLRKVTESVGLFRLSGEAQRDARLFPAARAEVAGVGASAAPLLGTGFRTDWEDFREILEEYGDIPLDYGVYHPSPEERARHARAAALVLEWVEYLRSQLFALVEGTQPAERPRPSRYPGVEWIAAKSESETP